MITLLFTLALAAPPRPPPVPVAFRPEAEQAQAPKVTEVRATLTLQVTDREAALTAAVAAAERAGGWFSALSDSGTTLRVPVARAEAFGDELRALGELVERGFQSTDRTAELESLRTRLASREQMLARYEEVLAGASPKAVVAVERDMTRVVQEIEGIKGKIRALEDRVGYASVEVSFRFRDRAAPSRDGTSSFAWLNTMNMADFLSDLETGRRASRSLLPVDAPAGFAPYRRRGRFQAVSPEDVAFRVRSARNKPRADLPFWKEALRTRMVDAGYKVVREADVTAADGRPGYLLELAAANGPHDQAYVVGLFVAGRRLVIAEATGEARAFAGRRDAVVAAIQGMGR